jgi:soluble lytic murein transglycosylase-like protein
MQIKHATARSLGYTGPSSGLLDANTNLTYAVKYLAGAYQAAGGDYRRAVGYYARGYYYAAKSQRVIHVASRRSLREAEARAPDGTLLAQTSTR